MQMADMICPTLQIQHGDILQWETVPMLLAFCVEGASKTNPPGRCYTQMCVTKQSLAVLNGVELNHGQFEAEMFFLFTSLIPCLSLHWGP